MSFLRIAGSAHGARLHPHARTLATLAVLSSSAWASLAHAQGQIAALPIGTADSLGRGRVLPLVQVHYAPLGGVGFGLLGDGSVIAWGAEATVPANLPPARKVQAFTALLTDGSIRYWGSGVQPPAGLSDYTDISASEHVLAIRSGGTVVAFGAQNEGSFIPPDLGSVVKVSAGGGHSMALRPDGTVTCWGQNWHYYSGGQCNVPEGLEGVTQIAAGGFHSMALRSDGTVVCWGSNWLHMQPNHMSMQSEVPAGLSGVRSIAAGGYHSLALKENGEVVCWGANRFVSAGPPPIGVAILESDQATPPPTANGAVLLAAGEYTSFALKADGASVGWGVNQYGQARPPEALTGVTRIELGDYHGIAKLADNTLRCWGSNDNGYFGYGGQCEVPATLGPVVSFSAGSNHSMAAKPDGTVVCWGSNQGKFFEYLGQCVVPSGLSGVTSVSAGRCHSMALRSNGTVACWGAGTVVGPSGTVHQFGQSIVPSGLSGVTQISAGYEISMALRSNAQITVWGNPASGATTVPSAVQGVTTAIEPLMALRSDGTVVCWGPTIEGIVFGTAANGTPIVSGTIGQAVRILGQTLTGVVDISGGKIYRAALRSNGTVVAWGFTGALTPANTPIPGIVQVEAGSDMIAAHALLGPSVGGCGTTQGSGSASPNTGGAMWQDLNIWNWSNQLPRLPGAQSSVNLGAYGSVGSVCDANAGTLTTLPGSTLIVPADLTQPVVTDQVIDITTSAALAGRVWLVGSGASVLPGNLSIDVLATPSFSGYFDIVQSNIPAPPGKFLTILPVSSLAGVVTFRLTLLDLPGGESLTGGDTATASGAAIAADTMDLNGDGFDDLALAIDVGGGQNGIVQVLLNDGQGNLDSSQSVLADAGATQPTSIATGDVNGDGRDDLVVGLAGNNTAKLFLGGGSGTGTLTGSTVYTASGTPLSVLIIPSESGGPGEVVVGTTGTTNRVAVYGASSGTPNQQVAVQPQPRAIGRRGRTVGTGGSTTTTVDGFADSSLINENGAVAVLVPNASGVYSVSQTIAIPGKPVHLDFADIDGDGFAEIVTTNESPVSQGAGIPLPVLTLLRGSAAGLGNPVPIAPTNATRGLDVTLVDGDADGTLDIASVHRTTGTQSEAILIEVDVAAPGGALAIGDENEIPATTPILSARGNLDGVGGDDLYLVDAGGAASLKSGAGSVARPFRGVMPKVPPCMGDIDGNGEVDGADLALVLNDWGIGGTSADIDGNGEVDGADLAILLNAWGPCGQR